jgi:hypothetical protein
VISLECQQDPFQIAQWTRLDSNSVTYRQKGPRLVRDSRRHQCLDGVDLDFIDWYRQAAITYNLNNAGSLQNRESVLGIEPAKQVAREEGSVHNLHSVRPTLPALVQGQKPFIALPPQMICNAHFMSRPNLQSKPRELDRLGLDFASSAWIELVTWEWSHFDRIG